MGRTYDVIVVGLGAMGSAATFRVAKRGLSVLGIDRFEPPHEFGSSHGKTRIIREAYFEDPRYVPLVARAYELWLETERLSGRTLFERTGGLMLGPPEGRLARGALESARVHRLAHDVLSAEDVRRRYPAIRPTVDMIGVVEPRAGILAPEEAVRAQIELAVRYGAVVATRERVKAWDDHDGGVRVETDHSTYQCRRLVIAAGAWTRELAPELPLIVERQTVHWFRPAVATDLFAPGRFPVVLCEYAPGRFWYAFPDRGEGVKLAIHHDGAAVDPDSVERQVKHDEIEYVRALLRTFLPAADGPVIESSVCLYTNTPDEHFLIDTLPTHPNVDIVSACSGHGFKFASAIGDIVASGTTLDLAPFRMRFNADSARPRPSGIR